MKVYYIRRIPLWRKFYAINLFGFIFAKGPLNCMNQNHEYIHTLQQREMFYVFFYVVYGLEWIFKLFYYHDWYKAYENLSFEREAYHYQFNLKYPKHRKPFAWVHFLWMGTHQPSVL